MIYWFISLLLFITFDIYNYIFLFYYKLYASIALVFFPFHFGIWWGCWLVVVFFSLHFKFFFSFCQFLVEINKSFRYSRNRTRIFLQQICRAHVCRHVFLLLCAIKAYGILTCAWTKPHVGAISTIWIHHVSPCVFFGKIRCSSFAHSIRLNNISNLYFGFCHSTADARCILWGNSWLFQFFLSYSNHLYRISSFFFLQ